MVVSSARWASTRIITGTILGGILGFYVMHRLELRHKEKMQERLLKYEMEKKKREGKLEFQDSSPSTLSES
ncbi:ATP-dependent helicase/nuclease subunit A isoform 1 [Cinnamomum micranthum f. kanehirae]|uniref:ATP-dependent helicase/nuclease subunit A isoform 1 n=1 Tax=Cinnamomum micranthum f. kanehirae TaxID=337451 RepID=A0A443NU92_9MAGN|nr:ATP-dependent helicase/nuclease subunit A isoform 1 [Cinnamomum micranthum f. kanehirae]